MSTKKTLLEDLTKELTADLEPVKPLANPYTRFLVWFLSSFGFITTVLYIIQPFREGFFHDLSVMTFALESLLAFLPILSLGMVVFTLSIPGLKVSKTQIGLSLLPLGLFLVLLFYGLYVQPNLTPTTVGHRQCVYEILTLSWVPILGLAYLLRQGYVLPSWKLGAFVGLAGGCIPMALMQFACMHDPLHNLKWHVAPVIIVTLAVSFGARWILKPKI